MQTIALELHVGADKPTHPRVVLAARKLLLLFTLSHPAGIAATHLLDELSEFSGRVWTYRQMRYGTRFLLRRGLIRSEGTKRSAIYLLADASHNQESL